MSCSKTFTLAALTLLGFGCGGCTTTPSGSSALAKCTDAQETTVALDDASALGFSGARLLALAAANRTVPISWNEGFHGGDTLELTFEPANGPEGGAQVVERVGLNHTPPELCPTELRVAVHARVKTADGALDESFDTRLIAQTSDNVRFDHDLDAAARARVWQGQGQPDKDALSVYGAFTSYGAAGVVYAKNSPSLAQWPYQPECSRGVPILHDDVSPGAADLVALANGAGSLSRDKGTTLLPATLTARPLARAACYAPTSALGGAGALESAIELAVQPQAGNALTVRARLSADLDKGGQLAAAGLVTPLVEPCTSSGALDVADFVAKCGDFGFDLSHVDGASFDVYGTFSRASYFEGTISVRGLLYHGCTRNAAPPVSDGLLDCRAGGQPETVEVGSIHFGRQLGPI